MKYPWERSYSPGVSWREPLVPQPIESFLESAAAKWPDKAAVDFNDHIMTFRQLRDLAARAAKGFQGLGVGPGVHVGLHLPNTPHFIVAFFGALMAGGRVVVFNPHAPRREFENQLVDSDTQVIVTSDPHVVPPKGVGVLETIVVCQLDELPRGLRRHAFDGPFDGRCAETGCVVAFSELTDNDGCYRAHPHGLLEDEVAVLQYTGGTSGEPKGAMLTHANFSTVPHVIGRWVGNLMDENSSVLVVLPLFHVFGLVIVLLSIAVGTKIVLHRRFEVERTLADIARKKITVFFGVPTIYAAIVRHPTIENANLSFLQLCGSGGAPLPLEIFCRFRALTGLAILEGYSLTEITDVGTWQPVSCSARPGTVGVPLPLTVVEVVDLETGMEVLPIGQKGEICFSGPQLMKGYWKNADATSEALRGGRFHSGDIGFMDRDGYVTLLDRKKSMILSGGRNVFPRKIEEAIYQHPAVTEVAVVGIPDPYLGEIPKAFVALKPGHEPFTELELQTFLTDKLARHEMPRQLEIKSPVGKLSKKDLVVREPAIHERPEVSSAKVL
jgi:long-chain acyl-CoA synthetase